ncbi:MAG TPA: translation initiation factor IF-2 [Candidatus Binatia bacterium]|nr:translation initiation factor IF-2 [Candidatus Binatia bacterium]
MSKRISEVAKEWGVNAKDLLAKLEQVGIKGKRAQSGLTDDELGRLRVEMGFAPQATVSVGSERVVGERLVTEREAGGNVTAREQIVEARVRPNVIRRRTQRVEVVKQEDTATRGGAFVDDGSVVDIPDFAAGEESSAADFGADLIGIEPSFDRQGGGGFSDFVPSGDGDGALAADAADGAAVEVDVEPPPSPPAAEARAREREDEAPAVRERPAPRAAAPAAAPAEPAVTTATRTTALPRAAATAPVLDDGMRRVQVVGKINLKKPEPPARPRAAAGAAPAGAPGVAPAPGAPPSEGTDADRRKKGKRVIRKPGQFDPFGSDRASRMGRKPLKKRAAPGKEQKRTEITTPSARKRIVRISEVITVGDLAREMGLKAGEVIKKLMDLGVMATMNHVLDFDHAALVASEFDYTVENVAFDAEKEIEGAAAEETRGEAVVRDPVVTVMGHVDHGKTSLLDAIRATHVAEGEAGGITQHIGAYTVDVRDRRITFLDTPGHEAFTAMRARGAKLTDLVVLVVAADDGVMPQTAEAINHSRAAEVPIIVAMNKIDKPEADIERTKQSLADHGLVPEDWGGDTIFAPVSAKTHEGIDHLLDMILLQSDVLELRAHPETRARGTIVEAKLDRGRGPVATVLIQDGTLKSGDPYVVGLQYGRVRAMLDSQGRKVDEAGPSTPVEILGLSGVPDAGDQFAAVADEATARQVAEHRREKQRQTELSKPSKISLDDLYKQLEKGSVKELRVVLKTDVQGSIDALRDALSRLSNDEVQLTVLHASVGGVTESDVLLASASNAIIIGFNVRPEAKAAALAEREGVDIRLYTIIYDAINQVREALEGMLSPTIRERTVGRAEVRQVFGISGAGVIAGSSVTDGKIQRGALARLLRDHAVIHTGKIGSLRRFKDDVREVAAGYECGIGLESFSDVKPGDVIEVYEVEEVARRITPQPGARGGGQFAERYA